MIRVSISVFVMSALKHDLWVFHVQKEMVFLVFGHS